MQVFINGTEYAIEEFQDGWGWSSWDGDKCLDESKGYFMTMEDALKSANDNRLMDDATLDGIERHLNNPNQCQGLYDRLLAAGQSPKKVD